MTKPTTSRRWHEKLATVASAAELDGFAAQSEESFDLSTEDRQAIARRRVEIARKGRK